MTENGFSEWCILELMGHRRLGGLVSEAEIGGAKFIRIDVPGPPPGSPGAKPVVATQFYSPGAVYCITPVDERLARDFAARNRPAPVTRWELPAAHAAGETDADLDEG